VVWRRCAEGQTWDGDTCTGSMQRLTWAQAHQLAMDLVAAGQPWRLPNAKELLLMSDDQRSDPAIDLSIFPGEPTGLVPFFWSGSPSAGGVTPALMWTLSTFAGGLESVGVSDTDLPLAGHVRLVRDAPR
jgi:Protein of unknown function (DUF1566)